MALRLVWTISLAPISWANRSRNSIISLNLYVVSICSSGNGIFPGKNAFWASGTMTEESLPIEYSITGRAHSAATSRIIWMLSASSVRKWERVNWLMIDTRSEHRITRQQKHRRQAGAERPGRNPSGGAAPQQNSRNRAGQKDWHQAPFHPPGSRMSHGGDRNQYSGVKDVGSNHF